MPVKPTTAKRSMVLGRTWGQRSLATRGVVSHALRGVDTDVARLRSHFGRTYWSSAGQAT